MSTKKRRRGHGEGSIYQRQNGRWVACLDLGNVDGKRKRIVRYADTRKEAAEKLREMQRQHEQGVNLGSERQTVGGYLDQWLEERVSQLAENTQQMYSMFIRVYLKPHLGSVQLAKLTMEHKFVLKTYDGTSKTFCDKPGFPTYGSTICDIVAQASCSLRACSQR